MPSLKHSFKISEIFRLPIEEIFYFEPILKDIILDMKVEEIDETAKQTGFPSARILDLRTINDDELTQNFKKEDLVKISSALGMEFNDLFIEEE